MKLHSRTVRAIKLNPSPSITNVLYIYNEFLISDLETMSRIADYIITDIDDV